MLELRFDAAPTPGRCPTFSASGFATNTLVPHAAPVPRSPSTTEAAALAKRQGQGPLPTITLGPASNYEDTPPTDGIDIYFGSDLQNNISSIIASTCPQTYNTDWQSSVVAALNPQEYGLQSRQLGVTTYFGLSLLVLAYAIWRGHQGNAGPVSHVHQPGSDISQASSFQSSNTVVLATTVNDATMITVTLSGGSDTTASAPAISTASGDGDGDGYGFGTGDIVITLPQRLETNVVELIGVHGQCAKGKGGQAVGLDCVENAKQNLPLLALNSDGINFLAEIAFWMVYEQVVEGDATSTQFVIPASVTQSGPSASMTTCDPAPENIPQCSNCGGTQDNDSKMDAVCPGPQWQGCPCVDGPSYPNKPFGSVDDLHTAQQALANLTIVPTSAVPATSSTTPQAAPTPSPASLSGDFSEHSS
ncbi:hypothetical protein OEA41_000299 [Lepraria neglecta]|uniref:Uncharacterized protein n=1 Tax=Lepraria neglecta TaxID=209136 RepID=A0AAE0DPC2_9LECA|nr:hypothetical protein OEA41_000299 [Lepraria neglecta]